LSRIEANDKKKKGKVTEQASKRAGKKDHDRKKR